MYLGLIDGFIQLEESNHKYTCTTQDCTMEDVVVQADHSVTEILNDFKRFSNRKMEVAGMCGTAIHQALAGAFEAVQDIQEYAIALTYEYAQTPGDIHDAYYLNHMDQMKKYFDGLAVQKGQEFSKLVQNMFQDIFDHIDSECNKDEFIIEKPVMTKHIVNGREVLVGMTADLIVKYDDGRVRVYEFKTANNYDSKWKQQVAYYSYTWLQKLEDAKFDGAFVYNNGNMEQVFYDKDALENYVESIDLKLSSHYPFELDDSHVDVKECHSDLIKLVDQYKKTEELELSLTSRLSDIQKDKELIKDAIFKTIEYLTYNNEDLRMDSSFKIGAIDITTSSVVTQRIDSQMAKFKYPELFNNYSKKYMKKIRVDDVKIDFQIAN